MFVITRRVGEEIWIGDPRDPLVKVRIKGITGSDRVRVEIDAPRQMDVHRAEVAKDICEDEAGGAGAPVPA